jgi:DNA polymerase IIIc chi subunit
MRISTAPGFLIYLLMIPGLAWGAEFYSIQVANFMKADNAEQQCQILRKKIRQARGEEWRIDRAGSRFVVRIGKFIQKKPALELLAEVKTIVPDAIIWRGELNKNLTVKACKVAGPGQNKEPPLSSSSTPPMVPLGETETKKESPIPVTPKESEKEYPATTEASAPKNNKADIADPLIPALKKETEFYTIQVANFMKAGNAEQQCQILRKKIGQARGEEWRIDRAGLRFVVRIGKFSQKQPALELLAEVKTIVPDAIILKSELKKLLTVKTYKGVPPKQKKETPSEEQSSPTTVPLEKAESRTERSTARLSEKTEREFALKAKEEARKDKKVEKEESPEIRRALLWGTILEINPLAGSTLGLNSEDKIYKLKVWVERTEAVKGYPNFLLGREKEALILFTEAQLPFLLPRQNIKGFVEYKGDKYKRFFWIKEVEPFKP